MSSEKIDLRCPYDGGEIWVDVDTGPEGDTWPSSISCNSCPAEWSTNGDCWTTGSNQTHERRHPR